MQGFGGRLVAQRTIRKRLESPKLKREIRIHKKVLTFTRPKALVHQDLGDTFDEIDSRDLPFGPGIDRRARALFQEEGSGLYFMRFRFQVMGPNGEMVERGFAIPRREVFGEEDLAEFIDSSLLSFHMALATYVGADGAFVFEGVDLEFAE